VKYLFATLAFLAVGVPAWAAPQTVTLSVPGMTCAACPVTVKQDDTKTNVAALTKATENAGYPSSVQTVAARQRTP